MAMTLPGLGLTEPTNDLPAEDAPQESRIVHVPAGSEWCFEVAFTTSITITVHSITPSAPAEDSPAPLAEIFGTELVPETDYTFSGNKAAIYSQDGCRLSVVGSCESDYVHEESPMTSYVNLHFALENLRSTIAAARARAPSTPDTAGGPRVLVVGPDNAGKTSLIKLLTTYATRAGRSPAVVNLDPREGMFCLPGSVSAAVFGAGSQMDVESAGSGSWGSSPVHGADALQSHMPIVYQYGNERVEEAPDVFKPISSRLALAVKSRFEEDQDVKEAGIFVDLAGTACSSGKKGYDIIHHVVSEFSINILLILGSERVYSELSRKYAPPTNNASKPTDTNNPTTSAPVVLKLPKSGGTVDVQSDYITTLTTSATRAYFYGTPRAPLSPHSITLDQASFTVLRPIDAESADLETAFLPGGATTTSSTATLGATGKVLYKSTTLNISAERTVLAIKHAGKGDAHDVIRDAAVMGYLYVAEVDMDKKRVRVLSPVGGRVPERAVVWSRWPETFGDLG